MSKGIGRKGGDEALTMAAASRRLAMVETQQAQMAAGVQYLVAQSSVADDSTRTWAKRLLVAQLAVAILAVGLAVTALVCLALGLIG